MNEFSKDLIEPAIMRLIRKERFYAEMLFLTKIKITTEISTLAVTLINDLEILINPYFWNYYSVEAQVDFLKHELDHVIKLHFLRFKDLEPTVFENKDKFDLEKNNTFKNLNFAADFENNAYLPNLPKETVAFDKNGNIELDPETGKPTKGTLILYENFVKNYPDLKDKETLEYYYQFIKNQQKENEREEKMQGETLDDHSLWSKNNQNAEFIKEKIREIVNKAHEATKTAGGDISFNLLKNIDALNYNPKNWKKDLRKFNANLTKIVRETSRKKRNRRYGTLYPGYKTSSKLTLAIGMDTSGSMWGEIQDQIVAEINKIWHSGVDLWVMQCDTEIQSLELYNPKNKFEVKGAGGTLFAPLFEQAEKLEVDGLIIFSDMDNFDEKEIKKPKYKVLWAALEGCQPKYDWGARTTIKINKKV